MELNNPIIQWLRDLLSGDFEQGHGALAKAPSPIVGESTKCAYCCLGVLCQRQDPELQLLGIPYAPEQITTRVGLTRTDQMVLACMNDERKMTFTQIADAIAYGIIERKHMTDVLDEIGAVQTGTARRLLNAYDVSETP